VLVRAPESIELPALSAVRRLTPVGHVMDDVLAACDKELDSELVLTCAADVPLITPEAISALCDYSLTIGADFTYPVVSREEMEQAYPGTERTYLPFAGTKYTGGNVMAFNRRWLLDRAELLRYFFENRKKPLALVRRLGLGFTLRLALGLASLDYAQATVGRLSGGRVVAARLPFPELALDLDKPADLEFFKAWLDPLT
jgi:hypothetical protein